MRITIELPETLSDEKVKEIVDIWNKKTEELMFESFHYFNFQLHVGFKNLYQNFQGGQMPPPPPPRLNPGTIIL